MVLYHHGLHHLASQRHDSLSRLRSTCNEHRRRQEPGEKFLVTSTQHGKLVASLASLWPRSHAFGYHVSLLVEWIN
jgi:hypothetical protein